MAWMELCCVYTCIALALVMLVLVCPAPTVPPDSIHLKATRPSLANESKLKIGLALATRSYVLRKWERITPKNHPARKI